MAITLRTIKGAALTHVELDGNFSDLDGRVDNLQTTVDNIPDIGNENVDFGSNKILYSNSVATENDLASYNPNTYSGMTLQANDTGALYYAHAGAWRKLITDVTYGNPQSQGYVSPLSNLAYTGSFNDLTDVPPVFTFDGSYTSLTNKPTIPQDVSELADVGGILFSGNYNDLINRPAIATDTNQLTNSAGFITISSIPTLLSEFTNDVGYITAETDSQTLSLVSTTLSISNGNSVDLSSIVGDTVGNFSFANSIIDTDDSSAITVTPATTFSSDVVIENSLKFNDSVIVDFTNVNVVGLQIAQQGTTFTSNVEFQAGVDFTGATVTGLPGGGDQTLNTTDDVIFNTVTATDFVFTGVGNPTFDSGADFVFNTGNSEGVLAVDGSISASKVLELTAQTSAPTAVSGSFAVADGVSWDPGLKSGTDPYPVFYDGTSWNALY